RFRAHPCFPFRQNSLRRSQASTTPVWLPAEHFKSFTVPLLPCQSCGRRSQRSPWIIEFENLPVILSFFGHLFGACLAQSHAVSRAAPTEQDRISGCRNIVEIAAHLVPAKRSSNGKAQ